MCSGVELGFFFQAEDGIRDLVRSRGLGDVYKRQSFNGYSIHAIRGGKNSSYKAGKLSNHRDYAVFRICLLYTSDAADERSSVDLGGRRIIKKKKDIEYRWILHVNIDHNTDVIAWRYTLIK